MRRQNTQYKAQKILCCRLQGMPLKALSYSHRLDFPLESYFALCGISKIHAAVLLVNKVTTAVCTDNFALLRCHHFRLPGQLKVSISIYYVAVNWLPYKAVSEDFHRGLPAHFLKSIALPQMDYSTIWMDLKYKSIKLKRKHHLNDWSIMFWQKREELYKMMPFSPLLSIARVPMKYGLLCKQHI